MAKEQAKKAAKKVNKLLIGMVIGGAVGSVVGATMSKKTGEENRKIIKEKSKQALKKGKEFIETHKEDFADIKTKKKSIWHVLNKWLVKKEDEKEQNKK